MFVRYAGTLIFLLSLCLNCYASDWLLNSYTFNTEAGCTTGQTIIGDAATTNNYGLSNNLIYFVRKTAAKSCNLATIVTHFSDAGSTTTFRSAIYADNGSGTAPTGDPLGYTAQCNTTAGDGNPEDADCALGSAVSLTASTYYWMGTIANNTTGVYYGTTSANGYMSWAYSPTDPFPTIASFSAWNKDWSLSGESE